MRLAFSQAGESWVNARLFLFSASGAPGCSEQGGANQCVGRRWVCKSLYHLDISSNCSGFSRFYVDDAIV